MIPKVKYKPTLKEPLLRQKDPLGFYFLNKYFRRTLTQSFINLFANAKFVNIFRCFVVHLEN